MTVDTMTIVMVVLGALLSLSEVLALIPSVKANSIFQAIVNVVKSLLKKE